MEPGDLIDMFEFRRKKLAETYKDKKKKKVGLSKQHQMRGAVTELDLILEVLKISFKKGKKTKEKHWKEEAIENMGLTKKKTKLKKGISNKIKRKVMDFVNDNF